MMNLETIELLKKLKADKDAFPNDMDKMEFTRLLLANIGIHDAEIRDDLIYSVLSKIVFYDDFEPKQIEEIIEILMGEDNLFYDLENKHNNSVLTRSFSILQLVIVIYRHRQQNWLSSEQVFHIYHKFIEYFKLETDYRGYIDEIGWAHSIAHSADLFQQLFACDEMSEKELLEMLQVIQDRFMQRNTVYICNEDERMVRALLVGFKKKILSDQSITEWVERFANYEKQNIFPDDYYGKTNIKNLLRALYFSVVDDVEMQDLTVVIKKVLKDLMA